MKDWKTLFDDQTLTDGFAYFKMGKAKRLNRTAVGYEARVRGSRNYVVDIMMNGNSIRGFSCTCDSIAPCKHCAAAMYLLDQEVGVEKALKEHAGETSDGSRYDIDRWDTVDAGDDLMDYDYGEDFYHNAPVNREDRRSMEREQRRNRKGKNAQSGQGGGAYQGARGTGARRPGGKSAPGPEEASQEMTMEETFPKLVQLQKEGSREIREDAPSGAATAEEKPYRYFHYEKFRDGLNITRENLKAAERLIRQKQIEPVKVSQGYFPDEQEEDQQIGWSETHWLGQWNKPVETSITYSRDRLLRVHCNSWNCGCYYRPLTPELKLCPHIIATLLMTEDYLKKENPGEATNRSAEKMMMAFRGKGLFEVKPEEKKNAADELTLEPVASLDDENKLSVSFRTGRGKLYKIRKLQDFVDKTRRRETMTFGKSTELKMAPEYFSGASKGWFHFIEHFLEEDEERKERRTTSRFGYQIDMEKKISGSIPLYGLRLDQFFDQIRGTKTEFAIPDPETGRKKKKELEAKEGEVRVHLDLSANVNPRSREFDGVRLSGSVPVLIDGSEYSYYIENTAIRRVGKEDVRKLAPLLDSASDGQIDALIGRKDLRDFYHKVLPEIRNIAEVTEHDADLTARYVPPEPMFIAYLDVEEDYVVCRADVWYGSQVHSVSDLLAQKYDELDATPYRDPEAEGRMVSTLLKYLNHWDPEWNLFFMERDDLTLFNLLEDGIGELMELAEVRVTDAFRRLKIRRSVSFDVGVNMGSDLLDLKLTSDDLTRDELLEVFRSYHQKKKFIRLKNGDFFRIDQNETLDQLSEMMDALHISLQDFVTGKMHIPAYRALYLDRMLEQTQDLYAERDQHFKKLIKEFKTVEDADYAFPGNLRSVLRNYQRDGYRWLRTLDEYHFGGILADEMGLGKTLQMIAVFLAAKEERQKADQAGMERTGGKKTDLPCTSIVICPASLVYNWEEELHRFAPALKVSVIAGTKAEREQALGEVGSEDVLVTSYDLLKRDIDLYDRFEFRYAVLDEAQYIKNRGTAAAKAVKLLRSRTRYALTGTPIENRLGELWSIFDFLMPGFLYDYAQFQTEFENPIVKHSDGRASERLKKMTAPFILRRLKKDVLKDLPEKLEEIRYAVMDKEQSRLYDAQVVRMRKDVAKQDDSEFRKSKIQILAELTKIRQICCDPALLFADYKGESAKRESCMELIRSSIEGEHKALVFSQFTTMLELLENDLRKAGISYYKITGSTPKEERVRLVNKFNGDETPVFLISLKAGGTGLNLTGADIVIHYDPWWNLAAENQATDRAHRIGQKKVVTVYKLIVKGTIEEKIVDMQEQKKQLAEDILSGEAVSSASLSREDLLALLEE